ncbi:MAG TPA: hypothetical protein VNW29_07260 [Candidatus Sulfotelmatobacter sp.]|nr:hypothetical protein [Candidatus Sulfotelmatobacter sp.]
MEKKKIIIIFIIIFILQLFFRIYSYRNDYLTQYNASYWKERFENSQWSNKPACSNLDPHVNPYTCIWDDRWYENHKNDLNAQYLKKNSIGDDGLYTYAGWAYIHGKDPTTLNAEIPPFGKYLIGLSEIIFNNQNIFALISSLFVLVAFYLLNTVLFKDKVLAFIPVVLFSFDPLFYTQLNTTMLDALYLGLLFLIFYFFLRRQFIVSAIFLGLMTATKSPVSTFVLISLVTLFYIFLTKQKHVLKQYFVSLSVAIIVFILTYLKYFLEGHSLKAFLGVQKWIITFYLHGAKGSLITPWEMIITGKWHTWWGTYIPFSLWHVGWWLITPLSMLAIYIMIRRRHTRSMSLIAIWLIAYFSMLSLIPTWPRYLLLVLPFMYNFSIWIVYNIPIVKKVWSKIT